jgi:hypothetical protein
VENIIHSLNNTCIGIMVLISAFHFYMYFRRKDLKTNLHLAIMFVIFIMYIIIRNYFVTSFFGKVVNNLCMVAIFYFNIKIIKDIFDKKYSKVIDSVIMISSVLSVVSLFVFYNVIELKYLYIISNGFLILSSIMVIVRISLLLFVKNKVLSTNNKMIIVSFFFLSVNGLSASLFYVYDFGHISRILENNYILSIIASGILTLSIFELFHKEFLEMKRLESENKGLDIMGKSLIESNYIHKKIQVELTKKLKFKNILSEKICPLTQNILTEILRSNDIDYIKERVIYQFDCIQKICSSANEFNWGLVQKKYKFTPAERESTKKHMLGQETNNAEKEAYKRAKRKVGAYHDLHYLDSEQLAQILIPYLIEE